MAAVHGTARALGAAPRRALPRPRCPRAGPATGPRTAWPPSAAVRSFGGPADLQPERRFARIFGNSFRTTPARDDALRNASRRLYAIRWFCQSTPKASAQELWPRGSLFQSQSFATEAAAKHLIQWHLQASGHNIQWLPEGTLADGAIHLRRDAGLDLWMGVQVKSTVGPKGYGHRFTYTAGYSGLLMLLVSLREPLLWLIPGSEVDVTCISIVPGGKWSAYSCPWPLLAGAVQSAWADNVLFSFRSLAFWETPKSKKQQLGEVGCQLATRLLKQANLAVEKPFVEHGPVDMLVDGTIRVQVKTRTMSSSNAQTGCVSVRRHGNRPYAADDFDALCVVLVYDDILAGLFVFPTSELLRYGYIGLGALRHSLTVYLPFAKPRLQRSQAAQGWQLRFFVNARGGSTEEQASKLHQLVLECRFHGQGRP